MPERARAPTSRRTRRFAAEGLTIQKVFAAVLLGATLGLLASVIRVASRSRAKSVSDQHDKLQAVTAWQTSQQANLLSDEKHRRELAEQARRQTLLETTRLKNDLQQAEAVVAAARQDRDLAVEQAAQAQTHLDQLSSTVQQLVRQNELASRETEVAKLEAQEATKQAHRVTTKLTFGLSSREDRHAVMRPSSERDASNPKLAGLLRKIAINQEVLVAVCGPELGLPGGLVNLWGQAVQQAKVSNTVVAAVDPGCLRSAEQLGMAAYQANLQDGPTGGAGAKFQILAQILQLGYAVLLTDMDVVTVRNPFQHLQRDADVEAASDGFSNATAYGQVRPEGKEKPDLGRDALAAQVTGLNPGLFYIRPTRASLDMVELVCSRLLARPSSNPKIVFNEAMLMPTSAQLTSPGVQVRVLDYMDFMNSGMLFTRIKGNPLLEAHLPVMVHLSFHSDKLPRMHAIIDRYIHNDPAALSDFS